MDKRKLSHDIMNMLERLRIMHDLVKDENFQSISKEEIKNDLDETLQNLIKDFKEFVQ